MQSLSDEIRCNKEKASLAEADMLQNIKLLTEEIHLKENELNNVNLYQSDLLKTLEGKEIDLNSLTSELEINVENLENKKMKVKVKM